MSAKRIYVGIFAGVLWHVHFHPDWGREWKNKSLSGRVLLPCSVEPGENLTEVLAHPVIDVDGEDDDSDDDLITLPPKKNDGDDTFSLGAFNGEHTADGSVRGMWWMQMCTIVKLVSLFLEQPSLFWPRHLSWFLGVTLLLRQVVIRTRSGTWTSSPDLPPPSPTWPSQQRLHKEQKSFLRF